jgi:hypothetical protein
MTGREVMQRPRRCAAWIGGHEDDLLVVFG